jgi:hypothetical protein
MEAHLEAGCGEIQQYFTCQRTGLTPGFFSVFFACHFLIVPPK